MMSQSESYNSTRLLKWAGKKTEWVMWEEQFLVRAKQKGYKDIALGRTIVPGISEEIPPNETEEA
jgi:hypothetical protein